MKLSRVQVKINFMLSVKTMSSAEMEKTMKSDVLGPQPVVDRRQLCREIKGLVDDGQVEKVGHGRYTRYRKPDELLKKRWDFTKDPIVKRMRAAHKKLINGFCINWHACRGRRP